LSPTNVAASRALFIPIFFIVTGFLIAPVAVVETSVSNFWLVVGIVASLVFGKGVAAAIAGRAFGYTRQASLTMWALTLPQVAATLVLLVVTSILGPALTQLFTPKMVDQEARAKR